MPRHATCRVGGRVKVKVKEKSSTSKPTTTITVTEKRKKRKKKKIHSTKYQSNKGIALEKNQRRQCPIIAEENARPIHQ